MFKLCALTEFNVSFYCYKGTDKRIVLNNVSSSFLVDKYCRDYVTHDLNSSFIY